jgi:hypothetical protein
LFQKPHPFPILDQNYDTKSYFRVKFLPEVRVEELECELLLFELLTDAGAVTFSDGIDETVLADELPKKISNLENSQRLICLV